MTDIQEKPEPMTDMSDKLIDEDKTPANDAAKQAASKASGKSENANAKWIAAGAAMGIGSAALVAALLYAGRPKNDKSSKDK